MGSFRHAKAYWERYTAGIQPSFLPWETNSRGENDTTACGPSGSCRVNLDHFDRVEAFADRHELMPSSIVRAAWLLVLASYTGTDEVCIAVHSSERGEVRSGLSRARLSQDDVVIDFINRVETDALQSHEYLMDLFDVVVSSGTIPRLKDVCNTAIMESETGGRELSSTTGESVMALRMYDARMSKNTFRGTPNFHIVYDAQSLQEVQVLSAAHTLVKVLDSIVQCSPSTKLCDIDIVSKHDTDLFFSWNGEPLPAIEVCVHELVEQQVARTPKDEAVCAWDGSFTYRQVWELSDRLAAHLRDAGVGPGTIVPLCFDKSKWYPVANLAVLKAGGACTAIDPTHPPGRIQNLMDATHASVVMTEPKYQKLFSGFEVLVILVPRAVHTLPLQLEKGVPARAKPHDTAFVVFTSGSTGLPKGIIQSHASYVSSITASIPIFMAPSRPRRRHLQFAAHTFDNCLSDMFVTLSTGGCVCIPSEQQRLDDLAGAIKAMRVNQAELTPTVASLLQPDKVDTTLDTLALTGENATPAVIEAWAGSVDRLLNIYGPAEATILTTVKDNLSRDSHPLDVGRPVGGHAWVVDPRDVDRLVPLGSVGELLLAGPYVSDGYLGQSEKTARAFVPPPRWAVSTTHAHYYGSARFYRTGDLARYNPDGSIRLVGRDDSQIKLRGQRVELAGIETHILRSEQVQHTAVIYPSSGPWRKSLVAVVVLSQSSSSAIAPPAPSGSGRPQPKIRLVGMEGQRDTVRLQVATLREELRHNLPVYMVPSMWLAVESIPLLSSGKLDRKLVKTFVESMGNSEAETARQTFLGNSGVNMSRAPDARPTSRAEQAILESCAHVLNIPVENIDMNDSFIGLGGDSISAMALRARCSEAHVSFSVQDAIASTSLLELAANAKEAAASEEAGLSKFQEDASPFPLSPIQRLFFESCPDGNNEYSQSIFLSSRTPIDPRHLDVGAQLLVQRHSMLRARFHRDETQKKWRQSILPYSASSYGFSTHRFDKVSSLPRILAGIRSYLNITEGPVFHMALLEYPGSDRPLVFLTAHHLIIDLVSFRVLLKDLETIMQNISQKPLLLEHAGNNIFLDKLPPSFQLWSQIQQETDSASSGLSSDENSGASFDFADFWGMAGDPNVFADVETARFDVTENTTRLLLGNSNTAMATRPTDILLGVLLHAFQQTFPERSTPTFLCESHGREGGPSSSSAAPDLDWSSTVGWFTAMFPVTLTFADLDTNNAIQAIVRTKDIRQCTFPDHGRAWFAREALRDPVALLARTEVIFNYFGQYQQLERRDALFAPFTLLGPQPTEEGGPTMVRPALLELALSVSFGKLQVALSFNRKMRHQDRLRAWMATAEGLMDCVAEQLAAAPRQLTLADVPLFRGGYRGLRALTEGTLAAIGVLEADVEDVLPLGPLQRGVLMSKLRQPESDWYDIRWYFKVRSLSASELHDAWRAVVRRHPALRIVLLDNFHFDGHDGLGQLVLRSVESSIDSITAEDDSAAERWLRERAKMPFVVPGRPLHRLTICSSDETDTLQCCLSISHAVVDGTSLGILMKDLAAAGASALFVPRSVMPWRTYISYLQSTSSDTAALFWKKYVDDLVPCILPATARPSVRDNLGTKSKLHSVTLSVPETSSIREFCKSHGLTVSAAIHASWALVLQSYAGTNTPCFGYLSSGRHLPVQGIHDAVGPFVNTLVLRAGIGADTTGLELMKSIQDDMHKAMDHQTFPLGSVQQLALESSSRPLFNTVLSQEVLWEPEGTAEDNECRPSVEFQEVYDPTEYDLVLHIWNTTDGLSVEFGYWDSKFDHSHVLSIGHTFMTILAGLTAQSETPVKHLQRCSDQDLGQIQAWQDARHTEPTSAAAEACVHDLISEAAGRRPDAPAVCAWDGDLTMAQLDEWSSRLASSLLASGLVRETVDGGKEKFVALCFSKGLLHTVAMLAALKAGAAVVSLEPSHPPQRLRGMVDDVDTVLVLCSSEHEVLCRNVAGGRPIHTVSRDYSKTNTHNTTANCNSSTRHHRRASPSDPAYIIFTSGSTGRPKGVVTEHGALASNLLAQREALRLGPDTRALQFASYAFDAHILETLAVLAAGGCVCVPCERDRLDDLAGAVTRLRANWALLTPTVAGVLSPDEFPGLKVLLSGGEAMTPAVLRRWAGRVHLVNSYGPSEASVVSVINARVTVDTEPANIGFACGPKAWVADPADHGKLVPVGAVGELLLEGRALARGYLNNPTKTNEAFIFDPAWTEKMRGQDSNPRDQSRRRFYATGDLVRYTSEGHLIYLGRKDSQLKIRGQRLEVEEIEHHLAQCPGVRQGAIFYPKTGPFRNTLIAVIQIDGDNVSPVQVDGVPGDLTKFEKPVLEAIRPITVQSPATREAIGQFQERLSQHMPAYMVPKITVVLESMPMSSAAKLDRKLILDFLQNCNPDTAQAISKLSAEGPEAAAQGQEAQHQPLTPTMELLRSLWAKLLNLPVETVKPTSSFLRSGGDSILALQLVALVRQHGLLTSVHDILNSKTLADLAQRSRAAQDVTTKSAWARGEELEPFGLSPIQRLYFDLDETGESLQTQSLTLTCRRALDVSRLQKAIGSLVATHGMLRARFSRGPDGSWSQRVLDASRGGHHHFACHTVARRDAAGRIAESTRRRLNIEHGPVFGVDYFNIGNNAECVLFLVAHHLVVDLVSWRVILHDLEQVLQAEDSTDGRLAVPGSFRDWCLYQSQFAQGTLSSPRHALLPLDVTQATSISKFWNMEEGTANLYRDVISHDFSLDPDCSRVLLEDYPRLHGINMPDILLAAISRSLTQVLGESVLVHLEGHGRESPPDSVTAVSGTVGWFTTMFPMLLPAAAASGDPLTAIRWATHLLRLVPQNGWQYFSAKYLAGHWRERLRDIQPEIMLNYHGRFHGLERGDVLFGQAPSLIETDDDPNATRPSLVNIEVSVSQDQLKVKVLWNRHMSGQDGLRKWLSGMATTLEAFGRTLARASNDGFSLLRFPLFLGDVDQLNRVTKGLARDNVEDMLPLSPMQASLLRSHRKGLGFYQTVWIWKVVSTHPTAVLDPLRVVEAWNKAVQLHQLMRTVFPESGKEGYQVVLTKVEPAKTSFGDSADALARLEALSALDYNSTSPSTPWHRVVTCRNPVTDELFCRLDISHVLTDGAAMDIILQDWATIYEGGNPAPPQTTFQEFLSYQRYAPRQSSRAYWETYLADIQPSQQAVPATVARKTNTRRHHTLPIDTLPPADALVRCATTHGTTPANLFRSAWALVLAAMSPSAAASREITFAYLVHGRSLGPALETASAIAAPLFNVLPCRVAFTKSNAAGAAAGLGLGQFVRDMHADYTRGMEHHDISIPEMLCRGSEEQVLTSPSGRTIVDAEDGDDDIVGRLLTTLVNYRRGTLPVRRDGPQHGPGGIRNLEEVACSDPMDYRFVLEVTQEATDNDMPGAPGAFRAALSFWEPDAPRANGRRVADCVALAMRCIVSNVDESGDGDGLGVLSAEECVAGLRTSVVDVEWSC